MSEEKKIITDEELQKVNGGYGNSYLCLPTGICIKYRVLDDGNWITCFGIIMSVEEKENETYVYDILREMSSIHDTVKAEDIYQM